MPERKTSSFGAGLGCLVLIGLVVLGIALGYKSLYGEREGFVKTDDCRSTVTLKEDSPETWFKKFNCTYRRTKQGVVMSATCVAVDTEGAVCQTVYTYQKKFNNGGCMDPRSPYLGEDDQCYATPQ